MTRFANRLAILAFRGYRCTFVMKSFFVCLFLATLATWNVVDAWKQCPLEEGGGICPVGNTCCPTGTTGISSCVPGKEKDPEGASGQCCDAEGLTGCAYGYDCALKGGSDDNDTNEDDKSHAQQAVCKLREPHPGYLNAKETPRYELCRLPSSSLSSEMLQLQRFPIDEFNAVYYSNMGSILPTDDKHNANNMQKFSSIETVLVIVHGSGRNADDYLCAGISTTVAISKRDENNDSNSKKQGSNDRNSIDINNGKVLVIAPKFVADVDHDDQSHYRNTLYWLEHGPDVPFGHTWRYGADAANTYSTAIVNASKRENVNGNNRYGSLENDENGDFYRNNQKGISSYTVMDKLLEFFIASKQEKIKDRSPRQSFLLEEAFNFPKLKRIVVAGHSAGGQYVHRWALLSSSPMVWGNDDDCVHKDDRNKIISAKERKIEIRTIVANPRSYCYPDNRRMIRTDEGVTSESNRLGNNTTGIDVNVKDDTRILLHNDINMDIDEQHSYVFTVPEPRDVDTCPTYDQWEWGLEPGGDVLSPYKDAALDHIHNNLTALALRYSTRKVIYLAGENDKIEQEDRCETYRFQGDNRNERARLYFRALTTFLRAMKDTVGRSNASSSPSSNNTKFVHEFHEVPESPHDHTLMFQSAPGRDAFYGAEYKSTIGVFKIGHNDDEAIVHYVNSQDRSHYKIRESSNNKLEIS